MFIETLEFTIPVELCNVFSNLQKGQRSNVEFPASVNSYGTTQDANIQVVLRSNKLTFKVDGVSSNASMISKSECKTLKLSVFDVDHTLMPQEEEQVYSYNNDMSTVQHTMTMSIPTKRLHEQSVSLPPAKSSRTSYSDSPRPRSPTHRRRSQQHSTPRSSENSQSKSHNDTPVNVKLEPEDPDLIEIEPDDIEPKKETPYMQIDYSSEVPHTQTSQAALERVSHPESTHSQSPASSSSSFHRNVPHVPDYAEPGPSQIQHGDQSADDFLVFQEQDDNEDCDDNDVDYGNDGCQVYFDTADDIHHQQIPTMPAVPMVAFEPKKRKLTIKSLETKYMALLEVEKGEQSKANIARAFGVPANTLSTWLKQADKIKASFLESIDLTRNRLRFGQYDEVENAVFQWYKNAVKNDIPVSGQILLAKFPEIALQRGHKNFNPPPGWLDRFQARYGISFEQSATQEENTLAVVKRECEED